MIRVRFQFDPNDKAYSFNWQKGNAHNRMKLLIIDISTRCHVVFVTTTNDNTSTQRYWHCDIMISFVQGNDHEVFKRICLIRFDMKLNARLALDIAQEIVQMTYRSERIYKSFNSKHQKSKWFKVHVTE